MTPGADYPAPDDAKFSFFISHTSDALVDMVEIPFLRTKVP